MKEACGSASHVMSVIAAFKYAYLIELHLLQVNSVMGKFEILHDANYMLRVLQNGARLTLKEAENVHAKKRIMSAVCTKCTYVRDSKCASHLLLCLAHGTCCVL